MKEIDALDPEYDYECNNGNLFECPEDTCVRSFVKYGNLLTHLTYGKHKRIAEKASLLDTAKKYYHARLTDPEEKRIISFSLEETVSSFDDSNEFTPMNMGWALPTINPPVRFTPKQKQFLNVCR